jgi:hypothetical protein
MRAGEYVGGRKIGLERIKNCATEINPCAQRIKCFERSVL